MIGLGRAVRLVAGIALAGLVVAVVAAVPSPTTRIAHADVDAAVDDDPSNQLWDCASRRVPLGTAGEDVLRCLTFRFAPPRTVHSAVLYLDISAPTNSLQETDSLVVAVDQPFDDCSWAQGAMTGCVVVHGGFHGGERSLVVDLLNLACDPAAPPVDQPRQDAVRRAVESGVLNVMLQDDTEVVGGWLDINGDSAPACGTSSDVVPARLQSQAKAGGGSGDSGVSAGLLIGATAGVVLVAAVGLTTTRRTRLRRLSRRIDVKRVSSSPTVDLDPSRDPRQPPTIAVGVTSFRDDIGSQSLSEGVE